jgi:hypothetical protein
MLGLAITRGSSLVVIKKQSNNRRYKIQYGHTGKSGSVSLSFCFALSMAKTPLASSLTAAGSRLTVEPRCGESRPYGLRSLTRMRELSLTTITHWCRIQT